MKIRRELCPVWLVLAAVVVCTAAGTVWADEVDDRIQTLKAGSPDERIDAAARLAMIGAPAAEALPELRRAMKHKNKLLSLAATWAVASISGEVYSHLPALIAAVNSGDTRRQIFGSWALASLGPEASSAMPALESLVGSGRQKTLMAETAIMAITRDRARLMPLLVTLRHGPAEEQMIVSQTMAYGFGRANAAAFASAMWAGKPETELVQNIGYRYMEGFLIALTDGATPEEADAAGTTARDAGGPTLVDAAYGGGRSPSELSEDGYPGVMPGHITHVMATDAYRFALTITPEVRTEEGQLLLDLHEDRRVLQAGGLIGALEGRVTGAISPPYEFTTVRMISPTGRRYDLRSGRAELGQDEARKGHWRLLVVVTLGADRRESAFMVRLNVPAPGPPTDLRVVEEPDEEENPPETKEPGDEPKLRFVKWDTWEVQPYGNGEQITPQTRLVTDTVTADRPFEVEVEFEEAPDEGVVQVKIDGGAEPLSVEAKMTDNPLVYRTRALLLRPADWQTAEQQRKTDAWRVETELQSLEGEQLRAVEKAIGAHKAEIRRLGGLATDFKLDASVKYDRTLAEIAAEEERMAVQAASALRLRTRAEELKRRKETLAHEDFFLDKTVGRRYYSEATGSMRTGTGAPMAAYPAADGATIRAAANGGTAEAKASVVDYSVAVTIEANGTPCPALKHPVIDGVVDAISGYPISVKATVRSTGAKEHQRRPVLELTVPGTDISHSRDLPDIGPGGTATVTFELDTSGYAWAMSRIGRRLPTADWSREYAPKGLPLTVEVSLQLLGGDAQHWNDTATQPLALSRATAADILCHIKGEAKERAEGPQPTVASTGFFRTLKGGYLAQYLADPSAEPGLEAVEELGRHVSLPEAVRLTLAESEGYKQGARYFAKMHVPASVRARYAGLPEWIFPATRFFVDIGANDIRVLDTDFLLGADNLTTSDDGDFRGGGRNPSNVMHWATGIGCSDLHRDAMRELFIGYEIWHLEGWDIFGEDCINDLISEEQGRLFGSRLRAGEIRSATHLVQVLDESFKEARAWVGALLKLRQGKLDRLIKSTDSPEADYWVGEWLVVAPWGEKTIEMMLAAGEHPEEVKRSQAVQQLIQIYQLIYWSGAWQSQTGRSVSVTPVTRNIATGRYASQFKAAPKAFNAVWDFDPNSLD